MRRTSYRFHIFATLLVGALVGPTSHAGDVPVLTNFTDGTPAKAAEVNGNFTAIRDNVNTNNTRLGTVEAASAVQGASIGTLQQQVGNKANTSGALDKQLTGVVSMAIGTNLVNGVNTLFTVELNVGDAVRISGATFTVSAITSDTVLRTDIVRELPGVVDVNIFSDNNLLTLKSGAGADKAVVTKSGDIIRRIMRVSGLGPNDGRDTGLITSRRLSIKKFRDETTLRIGYSDAFRVYAGNNACRWEIVVDGASCPGGALVYDLYAGSTLSGILDEHRSDAVFGYCEGISKGVHAIEINVGTTPGYSAADCFTGWNNSRWTIEAEEVY